MQVQQIKVQAFSHKGKRNYQEDRVVFIPDFNKLIPRAKNDLRRSFYAVFDGHGGSLISDHLAKEFPSKLANHYKILKDPAVAIQETWIEMETSCFERCEAYAKKSRQSGSGSHAFPGDGSTATVVLIVGEEAYATNCGDSSAVFFNDDGSSHPLTETHDTANAFEHQRCTRAGGKIEQRTGWSASPAPCCCLPQYGPLDRPRVRPGGLLVTRAFGDFHAKLTDLGGMPKVILPDHGQMTCLRLMSPTQFIVLASDGVWDALEPAEVFSLIATSPKARKSETPLEVLAMNEGMIGPCRELDIGSPDKANLAELLCEKAVRSPYWMEQQKPCDNTSAIILEISYLITPK